ncbi:hypothetical protein CDAR_21561 [Caerostris darwini]|uniref:Uncharacterized protein n=1 Tax=Caerostris darwini TaxID=1538125 RepID=A0AAV4W202_9ARAC|nr:hypothetical protein CDAR_21561 [Caerostris darwini]
MGVHALNFKTEKNALTELCQSHPELPERFFFARQDTVQWKVHFHASLCRMLPSYLNVFSDAIVFVVVIGTPRCSLVYCSACCQVKV